MSATVMPTLNFVGMLWDILGTPLPELLDARERPREAGAAIRKSAVTQLHTKAAVPVAVAQLIPKSIHTRPVQAATAIDKAAVQASPGTA